MPAAGDDRTLEEVDGVLFIDWQAFLIQSKFWPSRGVDFAPIVEFNDQVRGRPPATIGLFFAAFGVTPQAVEKARVLSPNHLLIFKRWDIDHAIEVKDILGIVIAKWRRAVKYGISDFEIGQPLRERGKHA